MTSFTPCAHTNTASQIPLGLRARVSFAAYQKSKGITGVKFTYEGEHVSAEDTPEEMGIEDGAELEALIEQTGGGL